ncbi:hypothetical protein L915_14409, partial [Phytophthora nicotianae]
RPIAILEYRLFRWPNQKDGRLSFTFVDGTAYISVD